MTIVEWLKMDEEKEEKSPIDRLIERLDYERSTGYYDDWTIRSALKWARKAKDGTLD